MICYFVTNEQGDRIRDKDGMDFIPFDDLTPFNFHEYAYMHRRTAEGVVDHYDPEGRSGFQVVSRELSVK